MSTKRLKHQGLSRPGFFFRWAAGGRANVGGQSGKSQKLLVGAKIFLPPSAGFWCVDIDFSPSSSGVERFNFSRNYFPGVEALNFSRNHSSGCGEIKVFKKPFPGCGIWRNWNFKEIIISWVWRDWIFKKLFPGCGERLKFSRNCFPGVEDWIFQENS